MRRWRGLTDLAVEAVDQGTRAVERIHLWTAARPFDLLERLPPLAPPLRRARRLQEALVSRTYRAIRLANRGVGGVLGVALDAAEHVRLRRARRPSA